MNAAPPQAKDQAGLILAYLNRGHSITAMEALDLFGCFRLAARIGELKEAGHKIASEPFVTDSGKRVSRYWIP